MSGWSQGMSFQSYGPSIRLLQIRRIRKSCNMYGMGGQDGEKLLVGRNHELPYLLTDGDLQSLSKAV